LRAYDEWGAGLLDSNLRYALGKSEVNKTIETELDGVRGVKWFHEKNNGVVIVCDKCTSGRVLALTLVRNPPDGSSRILPLRK
jgi:hypothetical protein